MRQILIEIFQELDLRIDHENELREESGAAKVPRSRLTLLGQASLLAQPELTAHLTLAQTGDLDLRLDCTHFVKIELKKILPKYNLVYDEDSGLVFIPPKSHFSPLVQLKNLSVDVIDPESALVSKAVKAPTKNKQLIQAALASGQFKDLAGRITEAGGDLKNFI